MLDLIFPHRCPVCEKVVRPDYKMDIDRYKLPTGIGMEKLICPHCYARLSFVQGKYCMKCGRPVSKANEELCGVCKGRSYSFDENRGMLEYSNPYADKMVWEFKYKNKREYGEFLALELSRRYGRMILDRKVQAIVPVPVHKSKLKTRGYNQMEVLAERMSDYLGLPVETDILYRSKKTQPQKELTAQGRFDNLKGAFYSDNRASYYRRILVVDDIFTTGATMHSCSLVLKEKGVRYVMGLTCCIGTTEN